MTNFMTLLLGLFALHVLLMFLALFLWRSGMLFMGLNILADYVLKLRAVVPSRKDGR